MPAPSCRIAVNPGDGIGGRVVPEALRTLRTAARCLRCAPEGRHFDGGLETYPKTGRVVREDGLDRGRSFAAILLGAVGRPDVPDHISFSAVC